MIPVILCGEQKSISPLCMPFLCTKIVHCIKYWILSLFLSCSNGVRLRPWVLWCHVGLLYYPQMINRYIGHITNGMRKLKCLERNMHHIPQQYLGQNQVSTVRWKLMAQQPVTLLYIQLRLSDATQILTSTIDIIIREVTEYGSRKLKNVTPLVLVDHFVLGVFKKFAEVPKQGPVLAKQQL